jgi:hypothetical protein
VLQVEAVHAFIGVPNEYFLHHRRHSRNSRGCRVPGSARLNEQFAGLGEIYGREYGRTRHWRLSEVWGAEHTGACGL